MGKLQFLRIESEHLGNVDGFRVTRDVVSVLQYSFLPTGMAQADVLDRKQPLPYTIPHGPSSAAASIAENDGEGIDERPHGEQFKLGEGTEHELGARVSKFPGLLPGEMAKRLKAAVLGKKGDNPDESDDEDDSPVTDTHQSSGNEENRDAGRPSLQDVTGSSASRASTRNYNTFGWESDAERTEPAP